MIWLSGNKPKLVTQITLIYFGSTNTTSCISILKPPWRNLLLRLKGIVVTIVVTKPHSFSFLNTKKYKLLASRDHAPFFNLSIFLEQQSEKKAVEHYFSIMEIMMRAKV